MQASYSAAACHRSADFSPQQAPKFSAISVLSKRSLFQYCCGLKSALLLRRLGAIETLDKIAGLIVDKFSRFA